MRQVALREFRTRGLKALGPDEGQMGLSTTVEAVIDDAVQLVESMIGKLRSGEEIAEMKIEQG